MTCLVNQHILLVHGYRIPDWGTDTGDTHCHRGLVLNYVKGRGLNFFVISFNVKTRILISFAFSFMLKAEDLNSIMFFLFYVKGR